MNRRITRHRSLTYISWQHMLERSRRHTRYTAKNITVCARWKVFANFLADMGERFSRDLTLDRINNEGNYEPSNCRWATKLQQSRNSKWYKCPHGENALRRRSRNCIECQKIYDRERWKQIHKLPVVPEDGLATHNQEAH